MDISNFITAAFSDEADSSLEGQIDALRANGIKGMEIRGVDGKNIVSVTPAEAKEIKKRLDDNGLYVWSIGSPAGKDGINDDFPAQLDRFKAMIESAVILSASRFRLFSFFSTDGKPEYLDEVCERLSRFSQAASGSGIILCHENEKGIFGDTDENCLMLAKALPEIKLIFDPANFIQSGVNVLTAWEKLKGYTDYVHIKDALKNGEVVPAGCGEGHIGEILTDYYNMGGRHITLEPHLIEFGGLSALEGEGNRSVVGKGEYRFESQRAAFDAACGYLKNIIEEM